MLPDDDEQDEFVFFDFEMISYSPQKPNVLAERERAYEGCLYKQHPSIFMTPKQEKHLKQIKQILAKRIDAKYRKGAKSHKGDLFDVDCLEEALDELIDGFTYVITEIMRRKK